METELNLFTKHGSKEFVRLLSSSLNMQEGQKSKRR